MGVRQKDLGFGDRLRQARDNAGLTLEQVASKVGVTAQAVNGWEAGSMPRPAERLALVCEIYGITMHYALTGVEQSEQKENNVARHISQAGGRVVPKLSSVQVVERAFGRKIEVETYSQTQFPCSEGSYLWTVPDRSNEPEYLPGDVVVIDPAIDPIPGDMVFVAIGDTEPIFRSYEISSGGKVLLRPKNPTWGNGIEIDPGSDSRILGVMSERTSPRRM